ncbi:hypothetical protein PDESU_03770 [Pontiella desulfatans]|uniref:Outer membrane protein beta-barrel domain-containing protein n=1 Tax=Pontiella desulfatans TaxID=2750659 RepID=A0A6C2U545_PONDE|nr:hypothetical protein [Pontiella desulfatans]VGO15188.1 hypothetical protein PDESU_03770 [Pontiella desulfatans]
MKQIGRVLLGLFMAGGLHVFAGDTDDSSDTDGENRPPVREETDAANKKPLATKPQSSIRDNLFFGGYINLSIGSYTVIGIEPMLGYRLTPKLSTGIKVRYDYIKDDRYATSHTTSNYGGSIFARHQINPKFYVQLEPATYNYELFYTDGSSEREWVPFLFAGGGYIQPLSERSWLNAQILFDVLQSDKSPYDDWEPFFSIGVGAGF